MAKSGCAYGPSGGFKTSQIKWLSHYIAETTGKATLLLSADGGGWAPCQPEVDAGMILPYRVETTTIPLSLLQRISKGYWPSEPEETRPDKINLKPIDWNLYGAVAVEGWTSIGSVVMRFLPAKNIAVGGENRDAVSFNQDIISEGQKVQERFGSNTRGDFGFVQNLLYGLTMNFNSLPCKYVLFTALEAKTEDDDRSTIYGPAIAGKKATAQAPSWVGDLLHAQDFNVPRVVKDKDPATGKEIESTVYDPVVRYYYKRHPDPATGIQFPAKPRVPPERIAEMEKTFPGGYFVPDTSGGFDRYLRRVDELNAGSADSLKGWRDRLDAKLGRAPQVSQQSTKPEVRQ